MKEGGNFLKKLYSYIRRGGGVGVSHENLVSLTKLIMQVGHGKNFIKLTFRAVALRQGEFTFVINFIGHTVWFKSHFDIIPYSRAGSLHLRVHMGVVNSLINFPVL